MKSARMAGCRPPQCAAKNELNIFESVVRASEWESALCTLDLPEAPTGLQLARSDKEVVILFDLQELVWTLVQLVLVLG